VGTLVRNFCGIGALIAYLHTVVDRDLKKLIPKRYVVLTGSGLRRFPRRRVSPRLAKSRGILHLGETQLRAPTPRLVVSENEGRYLLGDSLVVGSLRYSVDSARIVQGCESNDRTDQLAKTHRVGRVAC